MASTTVQVLDSSEVQTKYWEGELTTMELQNSEEKDSLIHDASTSFSQDKANI